MLHCSSLIFLPKQAAKDIESFTAAAKRIKRKEIQGGAAW